MSEPVDLKAYWEARAADAWQRYVDALLISQEQPSLANGMAAGRAYREFIDCFLREEQREQLAKPGQVIHGGFLQRDRAS